MSACPKECLCERCARILTCVDCEYFPLAKGRCEGHGTDACRYFREKNTREEADRDEEEP